MFLAYTVCADGTRHFSHVSGLDISYDKKLLSIVTNIQTGNVERNRAHVENMEAEIRRLREQQSLPPIVELIVEHNRKTVQEQVHEQRRLATAEALINGTLVRDVMFYEKIEDAVKYTSGESADA